MKITFSVVIPVFNREALIKQTIDSVLSQTYTLFELIVINDGSTDRTQDILETYGNRITTITQSNQGPESARYNGITHTKGKYLVFLDSDDLMMPYTLQIYATTIKEFNDPPLLIGSLLRAHPEDIDKTLSKVPSIHTTITAYFFHDYLSKDVETGISNSIITIKKDTFKSLLFKLSQVKCFPLDDLHFTLHYGTIGPCIVILQPHTIVYRIHSGNTEKQIEFLSNGALSLVRLEWQGHYPGGINRLLDRWARIGGVTYSIARRALQRKCYALAYKLFITSAPMIFTASIKKILRRWKKNTPITFMTLK